MMQLIPEINAHFNGLKERLECMETLGFQGEGWFKVELLTLLRRLKQEQKISHFDREIPLELVSLQGNTIRKRIDLVIDKDGQRHWIEIKQWLIGAQHRVSYSPTSYFNDPTSVGIIQDVEKLSATPLPDQRWLMILLTKNPGTNAWDIGLEKFSKKFLPYNLLSLTSPTNYPDYYFLGVLQVGTAVSE
jgi:hypothetical protein